MSLGATQTTVALGPRTLEAEVEELCARYAGLVYRISRRYAHDESEAEDVAQDIWKRVIALLPEKDPETPAEGWLARVALNVAWEARRTRSRFERMRARLRNLFGGDRLGVQADEPSSDWAIREVEAHVLSLPHLQKEVVLRRVYEGLSLAETAEELDVAVGTVKASFHRANRSLAKKLAPMRELWERNEI